MWQTHQNCYVMYTFSYFLHHFPDFEKIKPCFLCVCMCEVGSDKLLLALTNRIIFGF
jgi:hypothetical protein